jgi:hypothetical protein
MIRDRREGTETGTRDGQEATPLREVTPQPGVRRLPALQCAGRITDSNALIHPPVTGRRMGTAVSRCARSNGCGRAAFGRRMGTAVCFLPVRRPSRVHQRDTESRRTGTAVGGRPSADGRSRPPFVARQRSTGRRTARPDGPRGGRSLSWAKARRPWRNFGSRLPELAGGGWGGVEGAGRGGVGEGAACSLLRDNES